MKRQDMTVYQLEIKGEWVYLYSGRKVQRVGTKEKDDPFDTVECFRLKDIRGIRTNETEYTVTLMVKGYSHPLYLEFGFRNPYRINAQGECMSKLVNALNLDRDMIWDLNKRSQTISDCSSRLEDLNELVTTLNADLEQGDCVKEEEERLKKLSDKAPVPVDEPDHEFIEQEKQRAQEYEKEQEKIFS